MTDQEADPPTMDQAAAESILLMLADRYGRHVAVVRGMWGFSQGSGYVPQDVYPTLVEAIAEEAKALRAAANLRWGEAERLTAKSDSLSADADLIDAATPSDDSHD